MDNSLLAVRVINHKYIVVGKEDIVENTSNDYYWGCGKDGSGKNMLGKILMDVREKLSQ